MGYLNGKKNLPSPWLDLAFFAAVAVFSAYSLFSFTTPSARPEPPPPSLSTQEANRRPSSTTANHTDHATEVLRVPCLKQSASTSTSARLMQLQAGLCGELARGKGAWKARNEDSGEEIQVFIHPQERALATNFFTLKEGENKLVFEREKGKLPAQLVQVTIRRTSSDPQP